MELVYMFIFSLVATVIATLLGAILGIYLDKFNKTIVNLIQNFSVGAMIGLIFFDLFPESLEGFSSSTSNKFLAVLYPILIILGTSLLFFTLHELTHLLSHHHEHDHDDDEACEDHAHSVEIFNEHNSLYTAALIFLVSIAVHNIPEGLSLGISFTSLNSNSVPVEGLIFTVVLFIHNLLIGFSMSQAFKNAQKSNKFNILITTASSLFAYGFAIIGYFINANIPEVYSSIIHAITTGSILYVLFIELLPQIFYKYKTKLSFIYVVVGISATALLLIL